MKQPRVLRGGFGDRGTIAEQGLTTLGFTLAGCRWRILVWVWGGSRRGRDT
jgi:hypothetical protein